MNLDFLNLILSDFNEEDFRAKLKIYKEILNKFNRIHNLTQLKNIDENILDSIEILKYFDFSKAKNIVGGKIKCRKRKIKCRIFATNYLSFNLKLKL